MKTKTFRNYKGEQIPAPKVKGVVCDSREDLGVTLIQQGKNRFAVTYCLQVKEGLSYGDAADEYGQCVMHALACDGKLDNA